MATVSSIAAAIATQMEGLSFVDKASSIEFLPSAVNVNCVAFVVPFGQQTTAAYVSFGSGVSLSTTLTVEFWIQHRNGNAAATMTTARDAAALAIRRLVDNDGTGYVLTPDARFEERIESAFVTHASVPWLIASLRVPVENEV